MHKIIHIWVLLLQLLSSLLRLLNLLVIGFITLTEDYDEIPFKLLEHIEEHYVYIFYPVINVQDKNDLFTLGVRGILQVKFNQFTPSPYLLFRCCTCIAVTWSIDKIS